MHRIDEARIHRRRIIAIGRGVPVIAPRKKTLPGISCKGLRWKEILIFCDSALAWKGFPSGAGFQLIVEAP